MNRRVLLLSYSLGTGHRRAAELLGAALKARGGEILHHPLEEWVPRGYNVIFRHGYLFLALRTPAVWDWMYASPFFTRNKEALALPFQRRAAARRFETRGFGGADLVVATQYNAMEIAADYKRFSGKPLKLAVVVTDFDIYPLWARPEVDLFLVPHADLRDRLAARGVDPARIEVAGLPVDEAFEACRGGLAVRSELGFPDGARIVLLLGGGLGTGPLEESARVCLSVPGWTVVLVCGRNERLRRRLVPLAQAEPARLRVLGYRTDLPALLAASSLVVTKGGGLSLAEALYARRPVVALPGLPGQERANIAFMAERGWVTTCVRPEGLPAILAESPEPLRECPLVSDPCGRGADALLRLVSA